MEQRFIESELVVLDKKTGLIWQREASSERMVWKHGFSYIEELNAQNFSGYADWRYPTREELATLILHEEDRKSGLFIDSAFGKQRHCWSSTRGENHQACYADFYYGDMYLVRENYADYFVRAVRTL